jgi:hypothetical protein
MLRTYKAIINNDRLKWLEEKPDNLVDKKNIFVYVTILDKKEKEIEEQKENKNTLIDFFQNSPLYNSGIDLERDKDFGREVKL